MRDTIAVCLVRAYEEFQADSLKAIYRQAKEYGLNVQVFNTFEELALHNQNDQGEESIFERIDYDRLCGMIIFCEKIKDNELNRRLIENGQKSGIPVVAIDRKVEGCYSITFDYANGFEAIVRHLFDVHHCKSFFVMGGIRDNDFSEERIGVVRRVAAEYGLTLKDEDIGYGDFWEGPCREEMKKFLDSKRPLPDAFISVNDMMAITICEELHKAGYRVPEDTIVTGFDGIEEERYTTPRLTTAQQNLEEGGKRAVDIIWDVMHHRETQQETVIPFAVRFSQSCGCMPIQENDAFRQVQKLFTTMKAYRQFTKYMYDMMDDISGTRSIEGVLDKLPVYLNFVETFGHVYLCLESSYLDAFDALQTRIMAQNRKLNDRGEIDMVLLGEGHIGQEFQTPLIHFKRRELIPPERKCEVTNYLMFVPLHVQGTVFGYLAVDFTPERNNYIQLYNFSVNLSHILDSVKNHQQMLNFNNKLKLANDKLEELYIRDPLTGIYNRRGFYQDIVKCIKDYHYGWAMVVSIDLNGLKGINDAYGHGEGDFAIRTVGRALYKCVIDNGICARFGGDEFSAAVFFDEYVQYAERDFRANMEQILGSVNRTAGKEYVITCSYGAHLAPIDADFNIDEILKEADRKMYLDKKRHYEELGQSEKDIR